MSLFPLLCDSSLPPLPSSPSARPPHPPLHASLTILTRPVLPAISLFAPSVARSLPLLSNPSRIVFGLDRHSLSDGHLIKVSPPSHFPTSFPPLPRTLSLHYTLSLIHREISSKSRSWFVRPVLRGCESRHELMERTRSRARKGEREDGVVGRARSGGC